ncbi:hypothetical protein ACOQFO_15955 [Ureibacillus sp. MALMAid1270]|uniref:hypothetical protein n=1 Tax=Ureibacillus sp. MALMAid1270 TaxID=3411629 RepID=UPI003BA77FCA
MGKSFVVYLIIALIGFTIAGYYNWPIWTVITLLIFVFVLKLIDMLYTLYGSKNMKKVEKFLKNNLKEPIYAFVYAQAHSSKEEQFDIIERILKKYPQKYIHHHYRFVQELLKENYATALDEAAKIEKEPIMSYSKALVYANQGKKEEALSYQINKIWMSEAILATLAKVEKNNTSYEIHKANAIEAAKGIQRYALVHTL